MSPLFRVDPPFGVRLVIGCAVFAVALLAALALPAAFASTSLRIATTYALVAVAFGLLAHVLPAAASRLRFQVTTGIAVAAAGTILLQMEATVGPAARASGSEASLVLTVLLAATACGAAGVAPRPFVLATTALLGLKGLGALVAEFLAAPNQPLSAWAQVPLVWNGVWIVGSIMAVWFGRPQAQTAPAASPRATYEL